MQLESQKPIAKSSRRLFKIIRRQVLSPPLPSSNIFDQAVPVPRKPHERKTTKKTGLVLQRSVLQKANNKSPGLNKESLVQSLHEVIKRSQTREVEQQNQLRNYTQSQLKTLRITNFISRKLQTKSDCLLITRSSFYKPKRDLRPKEMSPREWELGLRSKRKWPNWEPQMQFSGTVQGRGKVSKQLQSLARVPERALFERI